MHQSLSASPRNGSRKFSNCIKLLNCWGVILDFRARTIHHENPWNISKLHLLWFKSRWYHSYGWSWFVPLLYPTTGHAWICNVGAIGPSPTEGQDGEFLPKAAVGFDDLSGFSRFFPQIHGFHWLVIEPLETQCTEYESRMGIIHNHPNHHHR